MCACVSVCVLVCLFVCLCVLCVCVCVCVCERVEHLIELWVAVLEELRVPGGVCERQQSRSSNFRTRIGTRLSGGFKRSLTELAAVDTPCWVGKEAIEKEGRENERAINVNEGGRASVREEAGEGHKARKTNKRKRARGVCDPCSVNIAK